MREMNCVVDLKEVWILDPKPGVEAEAPVEALLVDPLAIVVVFVWMEVGVGQ